ncbi:SDR family oxidoreductase [Brevibacillus dissolubilis]|uniref:SDR family oxidoreductase n=1 Tax=Brevibacillus dissolubilis TaxID=1844116 RepID=UPI00210026AE|nr:SDR family oxidoreductase [Brevibacillus dissolubilis]
MTQEKCSGHYMGEPDQSQARGDKTHPDQRSRLPLHGKVAVVAGATRGAGRGIAMMLGEAGATVYVTGRSTRNGGPSPMGRSETIEETAELVNQCGGVGIPVRVDHTVEADVKALFEQVKREQNGQLDLLVNDVWGGDPLTKWGQPFWEHDLHNGLLIQKNAVQSHMLTSYYGAPLMVERGQGLIIEITDGVDYKYRGNLYYSLAKISAMHLAMAMAEDLKPHNVTAVALTPGFLRSEAMLTHFGVTEENWRDATKQEPHFIASETPYYIGRAVAALAGDPEVARKSGQTLSTWGLSEEYPFVDQDGSRPHWGNYFAELQIN